MYSMYVDASSNTLFYTTYIGLYMVCRVHNPPPTLHHGIKFSKGLLRII